NTDWDTISHSAELWEDLRQLKDSSEQVDAIFVVDPVGINRLTTRRLESPAIDFSDRDYYFKQKEADQGFYIGQSYVGEISKDPIFNVSIRRRHDDEKFDGVVGLSANSRCFEDFYASAGVPSDQLTIFLVRDDGQVLLRHL